MHATAWTAFLAAVLAVPAAMSAVVASPALASECTPVKAAFRDLAARAHSLTIYSTGKDGKRYTTHMIQTETVRYVELKGRWFALPMPRDKEVSESDESLKTARMACRRLGEEAVGGQPATVYKVHNEQPGNRMADGRVWIAPDGRMLKNEYAESGAMVTVVLDYDHVDPPARITPLAEFENDAEPDAAER